MTSAEIAAVAALGIVALLCAVYAFFTSMGKGPILSSPYIFLSKEDKAKKDKAAEYKQLTIVFGILAAAIAALTLNIVTKQGFLFAVFVCLMLAAVLYAMLTGIKEVLGKK